jgi:hypothetical protein
MFDLLWWPLDGDSGALVGQVNSRLLAFFYLMCFECR